MVESQQLLRTGTSGSLNHRTVDLKTFMGNSGIWLNGESVGSRL